MPLQLSVDGKSRKCGPQLQITFSLTYKCMLWKQLRAKGEIVFIRWVTLFT